MAQADPKNEASVPRKLLFTIFLEIPGTIMHVGGILSFLVMTTRWIADAKRFNLMPDGVILLVAFFAFPLGRVMVIAGDLLSGRLVMPARKNMFALAAGLEVFSHGLCVTASAFAFTAFGRAASQDWNDIPFPSIIAALLFAATWMADGAFKRYRAEAQQPL